MAGRQDDRASASTTAAARAACRTSWSGGLKSGGWGAGVARGRRSTTAATTAASAAEAGGGCDVEGKAVHSGRGCGRLRGLLPDGLDIDGFGIHWDDGSVAGGAGFDGSGAVDKLELERTAGGRFEPVVGEDAGWRVELLRLFVRERRAVLATLTDGKRLTGLEEVGAGGGDLAALGGDLAEGGHLVHDPEAAAVGANGEVVAMDDDVADRGDVGSSRVDLQACKLEYSIVSPK